MCIRDRYIPIKAPTDAALAMGIINEIFANGWEDVDFLCDHTEAALLIKEDGSLLKMSDLGVEAAKGEPDPTTGEPTIIDPYVCLLYTSSSVAAAGSSSRFPRARSWAR